MSFAEVAVDAPAGHDRTFSYSVPGALGVRPGQLVKVPFGARTLHGVVFSLVDIPQVPQTRDILTIEGSEPLLAQAQLDIARWISSHYMCSLFGVAALMLPPGGRTRTRIFVSPGSGLDEAQMQRLTPVERRVLEYVERKGAVDVERLGRALGDGSRSAAGRLADRGFLVRSAGPVRRVVGPRYRRYLALTDDGRGAHADWLASASRRAPRQAAFIRRLLWDNTPVLLSDARKEFGGGAVKALLDRGWVEEQSVIFERNPLAEMKLAPSGPVSLTPRQAEIVSEIRDTLDDADAVPRAFLIQGVTGSGKTEIYLDAVEHCLGLGKRAIVMVPEIALTHQTVERFASRFPGQVTVLHSGLSLGERYDQWWKTKRAGYGVVIGSRSGVFSPQPDLGLIVVDEEHEWTYKQHDAAPRYHAREVALKMADLTGAVVIMGSATPDVVSYYRGLRKEFRVRKLRERVVANGGAIRSGAAMSSVEVVDMRRELREGNRGIFSRALLSSITGCIDSGDQVILFLNRRGSASYMQCRSCGASVRCRRCDIALTYHKQADRLICHYCAYGRIAPAKCPRCLSYRLSYYGVGTQSVAQEVSERFPGIKVLRWDRDVTGAPRAHGDLLNQFRSGEAQVLVGTQMIAKGLHFPSVTLVGVVSADVGLNMPDYRSGERAFQLLCQVSGRAGRGERLGRVLVQTYQPDSYAIQAAAAQNFDRFYRHEIAFRREQGNPPFGKLIRLIYAHTNRTHCEREASRLAGVLGQERDAWGFSEIEVLGPTPAYPARLRGRYQWHLVIRGPDPRALLDRVTVPPNWTVDIDPVALT